MTSVARSFIAMLTLFAAGSASAVPAAERCANDPKVGFGDALVCYHDAVEHEPLSYDRGPTTTVAGVERRNYVLTSQQWSPDRLVQPTAWQHDVSIYVPPNALPTRALLISTNGTRRPTDGGPAQQPNEFPPEVLADLAQRTRTVVVSLGDIPSQSLTYSDDGRARREDDSVAHSWSLFMKAPDRRKTLPLHVPMAAAIGRTMSLAERELASLHIHRFILTGTSKRGWASWHAMVADRRVDAVVPFVTDVLNMPAVLDHMYRAYGGNWPIAFGPYVKEGLTSQFDTPAFAKLTQIQDPLAYLKTPYRKRLSMPKYIVNASGDDFFLPDNTQFFYGKLPGPKAMRMVPNSSHAGIRASVVESLVPLVSRLQQQRPLPELIDALRGGKQPVIRVRFAERPTQVRLWSAVNPKARDFRFACGIRYAATPVVLQGGSTIAVPVKIPEAGWGAYFVEATYSDGFVATSQTYVLGEQQYPNQAPPSDNAACQTLPGIASTP
ncbi:PhoPQ-activated pathogenicity-related family protein [Xanthomonas campestris]|uniref:PhoPQ-activated pathogenicity-related family protein n=1 Tax=Xanthomonas campestris TaxID=339 RepID=UPI001E439883|nr:PhoPQ-activated protein PqaA family protein [Xanthomonas campestris]MCC5087065.1 PqaA [Xanthomonas campestris]